MKKIISLLVISFTLLLLSGCGNNSVKLSVVMFGDEVVTKHDKGYVIKEVAHNTYEGYTFVNWYFDEDLSKKVESFPITLDKDITLYAYYSSNEYTLTYDTMGGSSIDSVKGILNTVLIEPEDPTKDGFEFVGWFLDKEYKNAYYFDGKRMQPNDFTLYAKWIEAEVNDLGIAD